MDSVQTNRVFEVCRGAMDLGAEARSTYIERECGDDSALRASVESLLAADARAGMFLEPPTSRNIANLVADGQSDGLVGRRIGAYTITGVLGRGGMGVVYEARQDNPARTVALKVMRALPYADDVTPRIFLREGQALARLVHPGIAAIHEAGHEDGWYYFAMERVDGSALTRYAKDSALSLERRIGLMQHVCDAVHYAHQRGVIHRDLKPSNILVTLQGEPKVLDFGLAHITGPESEGAMATRPGSFQGTLAYTSPEQASGGETDTRSDVYSLGVVLYEVLSGRLPYDVSGLSLPEAVGVIRDQPPRRLAQAAGPDARRMRGDLETVVAKALAKEPQRRYASAAALSDDLGRFLRDEPVEARRSSGAYVLRKTVRRYRRTAIAAAGVFILLLGAATTLYFQEQRAEEARVRAQESELAQAELRIKADAARDEANARADEAATLQRRAEQQASRAREVAESLAVLIRVRGNLEEAVPQFRDSVERVRKNHPDEPLHVAAFLVNYASILVGADRREEAEPVYREALTLLREHGGRTARDIGRALAGLGQLLMESGEHEEAEEIFREAIAVEYDGGVGDRDRNAARVGLGQTLTRTGRFSEAEATLLAAWEATENAQRARPRQSRRVVLALIELYETWNGSEPTAELAAKAEGWRNLLD